MYSKDHLVSTLYKQVCVLCFVTFDLLCRGAGRKLWQDEARPRKEEYERN